MTAAELSILPVTHLKFSATPQYRDIIRVFTDIMASAAGRTDGNMDKEDRIWRRKIITGIISGRKQAYDTSKPFYGDRP